MSGKQWYEKSYKRILVDMHIPDWSDEFLRDFSADNYADMMALAGIDTAEIYAGSCLGLCYWPTKVGYPHRAVIGGRDILGETVAACRKRGIGVQIYLNVWNRTAYDNHPEWRIVLPNGLGTIDQGGRFGQCCPNTPYGDYFIRLLDELNSMYECDGFWIDMIGNYHVCYCPACRERFRRETPFGELPRFVNWNDPAWLAFNKCRGKWLGEFATRVYNTIKERTPERSVTLQSASVRGGRRNAISQSFLDASDYLAGDFTGDSVEQSTICKLYSHLSKHHPMEFMTPRCENLYHHTTERTMSNMKMRSYAAVANQCSFTLIDAIDPRGTLDKRFYEHAHEINSGFKLYEKYLDSGSRPVADIGIYHSFDSICEPDCGTITIEKFMGTYLDPYRNIVNALQKNHLLFRFVNKANLDQVPLVFLSDCSTLTTEECQALREYVSNGGKLFATFRSTLWSPDTGRLPDMQLADVFGVHYTGEMTQEVTYIAPAKENSIPGITESYPLMLDGCQLKITASPDCEVLGLLTLPISEASEKYHFGSAISNPPMVPTPFPAMVRHKFGKGEVIYVAGKIEAEALDFHRNVLVSLLRSLLGDSIVATNAPQCVECTLFEQKEQNRMVLSVLNLPVELPALPIYNVKLDVRLLPGLCVKFVTCGADSKACEYTVKDGVLSLNIAELNEFAIFGINF